jgi:FAD binding domain
MGGCVGKDRIERFQTAFRGEVIQPTDFGYERARKIWNASIDRHPGIIARCSGVADVVAAVNFARENELLVAVRGGGHNVSGKALSSGSFRTIGRGSELLKAQVVFPDSVPKVSMSCAESEFIRWILLPRSPSDGAVCTAGFLAG